MNKLFLSRFASKLILYCVTATVAAVVKKAVDYKLYGRRNRY